MLLKSNFVVLASVLAISLEQASARFQWLEREGRAVYLYPRRFGQEQPNVLNKIRAACPGQVCGTLAGQAVTPLLAAQPECSQQDMADAIIGMTIYFSLLACTLIFSKMLASNLMPPPLLLWLLLPLNIDRWRRTLLPYAISYLSCVACIITKYRTSRPTHQLREIQFSARRLPRILS